MDGAWGLVDLDWSQRMPIFHLDDIDHDTRLSQYPFQEGDDYEDDDEEDMEVESQLSDGAGDASIAPPTNTQRTYQHLPATYSFKSAQTPGSPQSTHTDTDTTMKMGGLSMAPGGPDMCHITLRAGVPPTIQGAMSTLGLGHQCCPWGWGCCNANPGEIHLAPTGQWGWSSSGQPGSQCCYLGAFSETLGCHSTFYINRTGHFR